MRKEWPGQFAGPPPLPLDKFTTKAEHLFETVTASEPVRDARILAQNAVLARALDSQAVVGMQLLNRMRMECGSRPLLIDPKLCEAARGHSKDMRELGFFSHVSPVPGKRTAFEMREAGGHDGLRRKPLPRQQLGQDRREELVSQSGPPPHHAGAAFYPPGHGPRRNFWTAMFGGFDLQGKAWMAPARQARPARPAQPEPVPQHPDENGDESPSPSVPDPDPAEQ